MGSLDRLIGALRGCLAGFPDKRRGLNVTYRIGDIGMAAFSVFHMQSPSFLAHQRRLEEGFGRSNCQSLYGLSRIPSDNHIREMLDPASPELLHPVFRAAVDELAGTPGGLDDFHRLDGRLLIALDGTEYHCSGKVHCEHCLTRQRGKDGKLEYYHAMLSASLVAPGHDKVVPLEPEFIVPQDGAEKQDCENAAVKRWLAAHGARYGAMGAVFMGDDLFSRQPVCQAVLAAGGHFLFVCKPSSHKLIEEYLTGGEPPRLEVKIKHGKRRVTHRHRWMTAVPLRDGKDALLVNWLDFEIIDDATGKTTYHNSFITDLPVGPDNVAEMAACGRARWKIENETFNVLKNNGYHLEHNFGHGKKNLATLLVALNLLAFAFHTVADIADEAWRKARDKLGPRYNFFQRISAITAYLVFADWQDLLLTLAFAKPPPLPP